MDTVCAVARRPPSWVDGNGADGVAEYPRVSILRPKPVETGRIMVRTSE